MSKRYIEWKAIEGYEGLYEVSNTGEIRNAKGKIKKASLKKGVNTNYKEISLWKDGKNKRFLVHRIVAEAFIPNENNLPMVNHKDEDKTNNFVENLEWCTEKYNSNYGSGKQRHAKKVSKAVVCIETGEVFLSQLEAGQKISVSHRHISDCCKNQRHTCGGYHWRYASQEEAEKALERIGNDGAKG